MILNVKPKANEEEIIEAYNTLTAMNDPAKGGSVYIQQKLANARDSLVDAPAESSGSEAGSEAPKGGS